MDEPDIPLTRATPDPVAETVAPVRRAAFGRLASRVALDISPLRASRDFRLLFIGQGVSYAGGMITYVALPFQAFSLSHSSLVVGLISAVELGPILLMSFVGGALADAVDRRTMVRITEVALAVVAGGLVLNAVSPHPQLWVLFVTAALAAAIDALQRPSLDALVPRLVAPDKMAAAGALEGLRGNIGQVAGPLLAGVLIATVGLPITYGIDVGTFAVSVVALSMMRTVPHARDAQHLSLRSVASGWRYALRRQDLIGTYTVDMNAMFFGMPMALFPQIASTFGGPAVLGIMYMAPAVGALVASLTSGWVRAVRRHGRAIALAAGAWGIAIVGFGFAPTLWLALLALAIAGAADMVSGVFRMTVWNQTIPDEMRGRLAGIEMISYSSGPALGNLEAGVVAALAGVRTSVVSGGIACMLGTAALSVALPKFWRYSAPDHAVSPRR